MNMKDVIEMLSGRNIKPTANRMIVLNALKGAGNPVSLTELEAMISTMDKSSIFRVLCLFLEHDMVHGIDDGSGSLKYEMCHGDKHCSISDMHVHFHCTECQTTYCFENTRIPEVPLPEGFRPQSINYVVKGVCPRCADKYGLC